MYDIIGDIHGHAEALKELFVELVINLSVEFGNTRTGK